MSDGKPWEALITSENQGLANQGRAVVIKIPELVPVRRLATGEFIGAPSTMPKVDFIGAAGPRAVAFDAKSWEGERNWPFSELKRHQRNLLAHIAAGGGLAFVYLMHGGARYVLPVGARGEIAGTRGRGSFSQWDDKTYRLADAETWLDWHERS